MKKYIAIFPVLLFCSMEQGDTFITPFETSNGTRTATYEQAISYYEMLAGRFPQIRLLQYGPTDIGRPLHLAVLSGNTPPHPDSIRKAGKATLLIINAIHAGEPDGVDACMMLARDLLTKPSMQKLLEHAAVLIVPVYNIDGALNRGCCSRANQDGPEEYGFRGNARNLDLNRDFVKCDSRNAQSLIRIFQKWRPDLFADTHTTNGADYQHVMTYIATPPDKLQPALSSYMTGTLIPSLEKKMEKKGFPMCPYVICKGETPDSGIVSLGESPRYSTGYASLFNTIGFVPEAHMLKPFKQRVYATYAFLESVIGVMHTDYRDITANHENADSLTAAQEEFPLNWQPDTAHFCSIPFLGYRAVHDSSAISKTVCLTYDRSAPYKKNIRYYDRHIPGGYVQKPFAYIIPQAWREVTDRLGMNAVPMKKLSRDTTLTCEVYYIDTFSTLTFPYEGHYLHYNTRVRKDTQELVFRKGDFVLFTGTPSDRFVAETLEPSAPDSYFNWNFFDGILMRKEHFSDYTFEKTAVKLLEKDPALKQRFEEQMRDSSFAATLHRQLEFIYKNSPYYEKSHNRYPVGRVNERVWMPLE